MLKFSPGAASPWSSSELLLRSASDWAFFKFLDTLFLLLMRLPAFSLSVLRSRVERISPKGRGCMSSSQKMIDLFGRSIVKVCCWEAKFTFLVIKVKTSRGFKISLVHGASSGNSGTEEFPRGRQNCAEREKDDGRVTELDLQSVSLHKSRSALPLCLWIRKHVVGCSFSSAAIIWPEGSQNWSSSPLCEGFTMTRLSQWL